MRTHQCPRCDLRFARDAELKWHLVDDHGLAPEAIEPHPRTLPAGVHERRIPPDPTHLLRSDGPTF